MSWRTRFAEPVPLPDGTALRTLHDARAHILALPEAEQNKLRWQAATQRLLQAAEHGGLWLMLARIALMRALYPQPDGLSEQSLRPPPRRRKKSARLRTKA